MHLRTIPSSGELLPVIGCGTWQNFDVGESRKDRTALADVLSALFEAGGSAIDSSPMYARAEQVVGDLLTAGDWRGRAFAATKVWTQGREAGIAQMRESLKLLRQERIDLMQIHNLLDWRTHLPTLREWKAAGRIKYLGVTHYTSSAHRDLEEVMRAEKLDFVQVNYSLEEREAEKRLLPLAAERGIAVLVNLPFGAGRLLRTVRKKEMPSWAREYGCETWAQLLLKFVLANQAVTCVIPGTGNPQHMAENCAAGMGRFLERRLCEELKKFWDTECR